MKKIIFHIALIFTILSLFSSCKESEHNITIAKSIDFQTGIVEVLFTLKGLYYDNYLEKEIIYFSDRETFIKTFNLHGEQIDSVPLTNVLNFFGRKPTFIIPFSKDTIFCGNHFGEIIIVIDHTGNIFHSINIDNILPEYLQGLGSFQYFLPYQLTTADKLLLRIHIKWFDLMAQKNKLEVDFMEQHELYCKTFHEIPYILELNHIFSDTIGYRIGLCDFYKNNFADNDASMYETFFFKEINGYLFLLCSTNGKIFKIEIDNFEILKEIEVKSKFTNLKSSYTYEDLATKSEARTIGELFKGVIGEIFYDKTVNKYLVIVLHSVKNKEEFEKYDGFNYRSFSIIVYDENFENPKEYKFDGNTYHTRNCFMTSEGFMIQRKPDNLNIKNYGTQTFDLLKFN